MSLQKYSENTRELRPLLGCLKQRAPFCIFFIDTLTPLTLSYGFVLSHALRLDRNQGSAERVANQTSQAVM
jgi:hypothetical protein